MAQENNAETPDRDASTAPASVAELAVAFAVCAAITLLIAWKGIDRIEAGGFWGLALGLAALASMMVTAGAFWTLLDALFKRFSPGAVLAGAVVSTAAFFFLSVLMPEFQRVGLGLVTFGLILAFKAGGRFFNKSSSK